MQPDRPLPYEKPKVFPRLWVDATRIYAGIPSYTTDINTVLEKFQPDYVEVSPTEKLNEANELLKLAAADLQYFTDRVENGTILSIETYKRFKKTLNKIK